MCGLLPCTAYGAAARRLAGRYSDRSKRLRPPAGPVGRWIGRSSLPEPPSPVDGPMQPDPGPPNGGQANRPPKNRRLQFADRHATLGESLGPFAGTHPTVGRGPQPLPDASPYETHFPPKHQTP